MDESIHLQYAVPNIIQIIVYRLKHFTTNQIIHTNIKQTCNDSSASAVSCAVSMCERRCLRGKEAARSWKHGIHYLWTQNQTQNETRTAWQQRPFFSNLTKNGHLNRLTSLSHLDPLPVRR